MSDTVRFMVMVEVTKELLVGFVIRIDGSVKSIVNVLVELVLELPV